MHLKTFKNWYHFLLSIKSNHFMHSSWTCIGMSESAIAWAKAKARCEMRWYTNNITHFIVVWYFLLAYLDAWNDDKLAHVYCECVAEASQRPTWTKIYLRLRVKILFALCIMHYDKNIIFLNRNAQFSQDDSIIIICNLAVRFTPFW